MLEQRYKSLWWNTSCDEPGFDQQYGVDQQRRNERQTKELIDQFSEDIRPFPESRSSEQVEVWVRSSITEFTRTCLGWTQGELEALLSDDLFDVTREFASQVHRFDPKIEAQDMFQALRNVWIMNTTQVLLNCEIALTPSVFAYSMLYPYTDNPLDDPSLSGAAKQERSIRLERRLRGEPSDFEDSNSEDEAEKNAFRLVAKIEDQYRRCEFPEVYHSLLAIHRGQCDSLRQQDGPSPFEEDLLGISIRKGGASVLADGYLTAGHLSDAQADFLFAYGVLLQFLDDLQDVTEDSEAGHMTVFSLTAGSWPLDRITSRLANFAARVLESGEQLVSGTRSRFLWSAMRRNVTQLLLQAVGLNRHLFSAHYPQRLEPYSPLPFDSLAKLKQRAMGCQRSLEVEWRGRGASLSLIEALALKHDSPARWEA